MNTGLWKLQDVSTDRGPAGATPERTAARMATSGPKDAFGAIAPSDPRYAKAVVDYCTAEFLVQDGQVLQVYEEFLNLAYWVRGFAPHNILEIGTTGATFFLLSRFATGKKVAVDNRDARSRIHNFMFGHEWRFFLGDSQTPQMRDDVRAYCDSFDLIFIDADHSYEGVKRDFENYRPLLSDRGVVMLHDVDPDHRFLNVAGGQVHAFWAQLEEGTKTTLCCNRSSGRIKVFGLGSHFGGIGIWTPS